MRIPQPSRSKSRQILALMQAMHSLVTKNLGLLGHVKLALVPAVVLGHMNVVLFAVTFSSAQDPLSASEF